MSASGGQKPQLWANVDFGGGSCTEPLLSMRVKFGVLEQTQGLHLHTKFHLNAFIVSASDGQKTQFWANLTFWGLLYRPPFTDEGQIWCAIADPWFTLTCQISSRSVYSVALCWRKTPIFAVFWTSAFSVIANCQQSENVVHGAQPQSFPNPTASKSFLYSNAFMVLCVPE